MCSPAVGDRYITVKLIILSYVLFVSRSRFVIAGNFIAMYVVAGVLKLHSSQSPCESGGKVPWLNSQLC